GRLMGMGRRPKHRPALPSPFHESGAGMEQAQVGPQVGPEEGDERNVTLRPLRLRVCGLTQAKLLLIKDAGRQCCRSRVIEGGRQSRGYHHGCKVVPFRV
ncbi:MAG: hypothetical protein L0331_28220, partial [Chloroflexi bacterium]|nr:hypothetical protein [Chloroflexota bacterium]